MERRSKEGDELNLSEAKKMNLCKAFEKLQSEASGLVSFALQWRDLEDHLMSLKGDVEKRFIEIDERAKVVEARESRLGELEVRADGFRREIEVREEELSGVRMMIEECRVKQRLMMEGLREIQGEIDLKSGLLAQREADLERHCVEMSEEMENLRRAQGLRRELDEENERKRRDLALVQEMIETRSLELRKTQGEIDLKGGELVKMEADLERHCVEMSEEMENLGKAQALRRELDEENERKRRDLALVQEKVAECSKMLETRSLELTKTHAKIDSKGELLAHLEADLERLRVEINSEMGRAETRRRELNKEIERKTRDVTLVQEKVTECDKLLETRSLELAKTQSELDSKGGELAKMEADLERHRAEMSSEMGRRRELDDEIERKTRDLTLVQDKVVECGEMLETRSLELVKTQGELDLKVEQLEQVKIDFGRRHSELTAEMEHLERLQTRNREFEEVIEMKRKDLAEVLDRTVKCGEMLETRSLELTKTQGELDLKVEQLAQIKIDFGRHHSELTAEMKHLKRTQTRNRELEEEMERKRKDLERLASQKKKLEVVEQQLDSQKKLLETRSLELVSKEKELQALNLDLDLREETVKSLNNEMESKAKELEAIEKMINERSGHCESVKLLIEKHTEELASKEKRHDEITEATRKLSVEIAFKEKTLTDRNKQVEEGEKKKLQDLNNTNEELIRQVKVRQEQVSSITEAIRECTCELEAKRKHRDEVQSSITDLTAVLTSLEKKIQESLERLQSTEEQQVNIKASLMEHKNGLELREMELIAWEEKINEQDLKLQNAKQELTKWVEDCEVKAKQLSRFYQESNPDQSRKRGRYDDKSLSQFRDEGLDGAIKSLNHVLTSCTTGQETTYNFENERSPDKFKIDQIWAVYSDSDKGMPRKYAQIKRIDTTPEFKLHAAPLVLYRPPPPNLTTHPVCCGRFKLKIGKAEVLVPSSFSHKVNAARSSVNRYEVYPGKGEIWALYKNYAETGEEVEIVEIVETDEKSIQAMLLTAKVFNKFLYGRCLETKAGVVDIPKTEVNRFSHQIPAFRRERRAKRSGDCEWWELDSKAVLDLNSKKP